MKKTIGLISATALLVAVLLPLAAYSQQQDSQFSGFLGDYSKLAEEKDAAGETVLRYINPKISSGEYKSLLIDAVQFYPAPKPSEQVSEHTLNDIRNYVDNGLRVKLGGKLALATEAGPGVLRIRPAITAVASKAPGLKPYEIVPIGFLISSVKGRGKVAAIEMEVEVVDSVTGERLGASVRKGVGAKLEGKNTKLTLDHLRPTLDKWIETGSAFVAEKLK